jgi:hypothetical protein
MIRLPFPRRRDCNLDSVIAYFRLNGDKPELTAVVECDNGIGRSAARVVIGPRAERLEVYGGDSPAD